ncbi:MAG: chemotaxis protein [Geobacteraceae bacterium GWC2_55_20]|nr:MAG: chemotaxis protein [Geobacteraceae bacterium GWC2_55_20]OGU20651.1 MAG: chemotaxis protein [Geobacteraceae bacterium GWF2_54_21]HBA71258.1 methyl-accepting chemotaxis protein [Geobacter sp.]
MSSDGTNGLTLRTKMVLLSASAFVGILLVTVISLMLMNQVRVGSAAYKTIIDNKDALENIALLKSDLYQISYDLQKFMLEADKVAADKYAADIKSRTAEIDKKFEAGLKLAEVPARRDVINKASNIWKEYRKTLLDEVLPAVSRGEIFTASNLMSGVQAERFNVFSTTVATMVETIRRDVMATEEAVSAAVLNKIIINTVVALFTIGVITLFSYLVTRSITGPLNACVDFARTVADGRLNLRLEVSGGGETAALAVAMNTMAENLNSMVSRVNTAAEVLTSIDNNIEKAAHQVVSSAQLQEKSVKETSQAVTQIKDSVREVSEGVDQLATSAGETASSSLEMAASIEEVAISAEKLGGAVEEVSSSITEMASSIREIGASIVNLLDASSTTASSIAEMDATIKQVEKNAMDTSAISESVRSDAETGKKAVEEAIAGMQAIRSSSKITAEVIENLSLRANDIGAILSVIDEVAEQTNLLALNAAIIAAQAGEHGKGFAVVADEIRELAERTSSSTREIAAVIKGVQEDTRRAVDAISQAENSIAEGEKLSQHSGAALEKIVTGVKRASIQVSEIARATVEQARGSHCIKEAMESVEEMVGHIANSAREHTQGTDLITSAVERMKDLTTHVRTSTREQSRASSLIARSTENVTSLVGHIRDACRLQVESSVKISESVNNIQISTNANSHAAKVMDASVTGLSRQIDLLEKEMTGFKI